MIVHDATRPRYIVVIFQRLFRKGTLDIPGQRLRKKTSASRTVVNIVDSQGAALNRPSQPIGPSQHQQV